MFNIPNAEKLRRIEVQHYVMISGWISRLLQAGLSFVMIPIVTSLLDIYDYSVFILFSALVVWFSLADLGLGYALQNKISALKAQSESYDVYVAHVFLLGTLSIVPLSVVLYFSSPIVTNMYLSGWGDAENGFLYEYLLLGIMLILNSVFSMVYKLWYATGRGYLSNFIPAVATVISFVTLTAMKIYDFDVELHEMILVYYLPMLMLPMFFFLKKLYTLRYLIRTPLDYLFEIYPKSRSFLSFAFLSILVLNVDYLIASKYLEPNELIEYNSLMRIFTLLFFVYTSFLMAIWPKVSELISSNKPEQVVFMLKVPLVLGILFIILCTFSVYYHAEFIFSNLIRNADIESSASLILLCGLYFIVRAWVDTFSMVIQSANHVSPLIKIVPIQAIISIASQIYMVKQFGAQGLVGGMIFSFLITVAWSVPITAIRLLKANTGHA